MLKKSKSKRSSVQLSILSLAAASAMLPHNLSAAVDLWTSTASGTTFPSSTPNNIWLNPVNWVSGVPGSGDVAQFNNVSGGVSVLPNSNKVILDYADGGISVGTISDVIPATAASPNLTFSNSSAGTLYLNGASVTVPVPAGTQNAGTTETYANTILSSTDSSTSNKNLTLNTNVALTGTTNNILNYVGIGGETTAGSGFPTIAINGNISEGGGVHSALTFLGGGSPTKQGGELNLTGTNTFTGGLTVGNPGNGSGSQTDLQGGELYINGPAALPSTGTITINEQSQLAFTAANGSNFSNGSQTLILNGIGSGKNISGAIRPSGGTQLSPISWLGNIQLGTSASYDGDNGYVLITVASGTSWFRLVGNMTGGNFLEQGGGVFDLAGTNNTYGGTQLGNGGIYVEPQSSLGTGDVTLFQTSKNNPTLTLNNASQTIGSLISQFTATSLTAVTNNANGYLQNISLNGTQLTITEPASTTFGYGSYYTLTSGINDAANGSPGSVVYNSTSGHTLTMTAQNSYSGGTVINAGTIDLANNLPGITVNSALGTGAVQVNSGATLSSGNYSLAAGFTSGSLATTITGGTFTGQLNVSSGGTVAPGGTNIGFLNTGPILASKGSIFDFTLGSATAGNYSTITSSGAVSFDTSGTETLNITGSKLATGTFDLITGQSISSNTSGGGIVLGTTPAGPNRVYTLSETGTQVVLTVVNNGTERDWSVGGGSPAVDGSGTWQAGSTNFFQLANGTTTQHVAYDNTSSADTAFGNGGSGGTITLGSNVTVGGTFILGSLSNGSYTFVSQAATSNSLTINGGIAASNNTFITAPVVLGASQTWSIDSGVSLNISGNIGQSTASQLTKSGSGTLVLSGTGSWTGGTTVTQGTLQTTTAAIPATGGIANSSTLNFDQSTAGTYAGLISGSGSVIISNVANTGTPSVTLSNAGNSYTGSTTLASGTLVVASVGDLGTGDGGIILSGGTLQATGNLLFPLNAGNGSTQKRTLTLTTGTTSTIDTQANTVEFDSNIGGSGSLTKIGSGTLVLEGIPSTTTIGSLISSAGTIQIAQQLAGASFVFSGSPTPGLETGKIEITGPTLTRFGGGDFSGGGSFQVDLTGIQLIGYGGSNTTIGNTISLNPQNLTGGFVTDIGADTTSVLNLNGPIVGNSDVDFTGGKGFVILGGTSTYTGATRIDNSTGGSIQLAVNNPLPSATDVTVTSSGNLDLNGFNLSIGSLTGNSATALVQNTSQSNNSVLTITGPASTTFNGILQDATFSPTLGLTLNSGTGALALPGGQAYSGPVTILSGRLDLTGISDGTGTTAIDTTGLGATSAITIGDSTAPASMDAQLRFTGIVGTVSYSTNNHPGTNAPTITLEAMGGFNTSGGTVTTGAIRVSSASAVVLQDPIVFANTSVISVTDTSSLILAGQISGTGTFISQGTGTITLTADNTGYTGGTEIDAGTFNVSTGSSIGTGPLAVNNTLNTGNGSTGLAVILNLNNSAQTVGSLSGTITAPVTGVNTATINLATGTTLTINQTVDGTYAGSINGSGASLVKNGSASLILAGGVTYTGTTNVSAGTLTFGASTLGGIQNITSAGISIASGAKLALGNTALHANRTLLSTPSLHIAGSTGAWTGTVDVGNNDLDLQNQGFNGLVQITNQISSAFKNGKWTGTGITSNVAASDTTHLTALGVILNNNAGAILYSTGTALGVFDGTSPSSTDVLVKYTYFGDTNLDGKVDATDYSRIDNGFLTHATGWFNGDFNYDNVINGSDYTLIDNAFNLQNGQITTNSSELANPTAQINSFGTSAVPEPGSILILGGLAVAQLGRRRRRTHA